MKIDRTKLKKGNSELPSECKVLIERIKQCGHDKLAEELQKTKSWTFGKCELYHWADVLDIFDEVLEKSCKKENEEDWVLPCDMEGHEKEKELLLQVLQFTSLLIEHSFSRHLYNSMEHLTMLMSSSDMTVVLGVLSLLYVFSKRSNFITRLSAEKRQALIIRLTHLAESWGGKENGFGLAECCQDLPMSSFPATAATLHFEYYAEGDEKVTKKASSVLSCIHIENLDKIKKLPSNIMEDLLASCKVPEEKKMVLFTHIRLAHSFSNYEKRLKCVQARLQAISILVYSNAIQENVNALLYNGLIEELVDIIELKHPTLVEIKAAALRTLTSIIHLERNPKLNAIIDVTGASSYHGFLPVLVRNCIQHMIDPNLETFPQPFATALFSFLYHLASYESGGEALVSCGMMESLLKVINWYGEGQEHITFVTRAVRVVDLITNLDMAAFQAHTGLTAFINRLEHEVEICRKEQPFVIRPTRSESVSSVSSVEFNPHSPGRHDEVVAMETDAAAEEQPSGAVNEGASTSAGTAAESTKPETSELRQDYSLAKTGLQCFSQRAALLKSMLNFLKKAIPDTAFSESIRHMMDGSLPRSLKHIISNAEYYGPSLFLLATDVVTVYVFQEPSLLSSLQDSGLTDVVLHALLIKDVPATREVLASLPNVFSALCLNNRGLQSFVACKPFERLFNVLLSQDYLPAMRRRRSSDPLGDTASNLGNAMDELMRHQPSLRTDATKAIIKLLEEVSSMGKDTKFICQKPPPKNEQASANLSIRSPTPNDTAASSDEDEEDDDGAASTTSQQPQGTKGDTGQPSAAPERVPIPLMDYVLNVMKFVEAILSNNTTNDHCQEFVAQKGLAPLMGILGLPNLPIDFPASPACQAVASVCKSILTLSHEKEVLVQGLTHLNEVLERLEPLHRPLDPPGGSVLLHELASASNITEATLCPNTTPILHAVSAAHAYIMMFVHVCRVGQSDVRTISINQWGSELGLQVLKGLSQLYTSLVWESTVLLALCSEDILPPNCDFGRADMNKLLPKDVKTEKEGKADPDRDVDTSVSSGLSRSTGETGSNGVSAAMESLSTSETVSTPVTPMEVDEQPSTSKDGKKSKLSPSLQAQIKQINPLLSASSRLGRALAELFGLLVKLCVGGHVRQRSRQQVPPAPTTPSPAAKAVSTSLMTLLRNGLSWQPPADAPVPKLRLTDFICSVGFTSPMLFDEKKFPYHLMLQKFLSCGGQDALFEAFTWALSCGGQVPLSEGLEHPNLPDGTGEFLDAWLMIIEKMVNTKNVLESPHTLPAKSSQPGFVPFSPVQYLVHTQKAAFNAVMHLWDKKPLKVYGGRMSESILAILCHIIKGEDSIKEKLAKEREEQVEPPSGTSGSSAASSAPSSAGSSGIIPPSANPFGAMSAPTPQEADINQEHLQQLMDMGFTREHAMDALMHTTSLEQATEYILLHPPPAPPVLQTAGLDLDLSEEDQMMRAIAMSLGENVTAETTDAQPSAEEEAKKKEEEAKKEEEERNRKEEEEAKEREREKQKWEDPMPKEVIDNFTDSMLPGCMRLLDTLPETVHRICDLLVVVTSRNGDKWKEKMLKDVVKEICDYSGTILEAAAPLSSTDTKTVSEWAADISTIPEAGKLAARLHLFSLLFEEMKMPCAEAVESSDLLDTLVRLLEAAQQCLAAAKQQGAVQVATPKWLAPLLLLIDLYEKASLVSKRKVELEKVIGSSRTWKWFDDRSGRWCNCSITNNKTIDDAYRSGEASVRFTAGRRRYTVNFTAMVQINEETGNRRPIMLALPSKEEREKAKTEKEEKAKESSATGGDIKGDSKMETEESNQKVPKIVRGLRPDQIAGTVRAAVGLIGVPVDPDALHAVMRVCLRLTREHQYAVIFAEMGGAKLLLSLTQASTFQGFTSLATLLLRHILEDPITMKHTMEKVIRAAAVGSGSPVSGVGQGSLGSKEMHYVLRALGPAACRNPQLFSEVSQSILRIALPPPSKRDEDESRFTGPNAAQILKPLPSKQAKPVDLVPAMQSVVVDLLDALTLKYSWIQEEGTARDESKPPQTLAEAIQEVVSEVTRELNEQQTPGILRQDNSVDVGSQEEGEGQSSSVQSGDKEPSGKTEKELEKEKKEKAEEEKKKLPLLPKSAVMRLLAELIRSYGSCAQIITQHTYTAGMSDLVTEDCSVLAFILDNFLPQSQTVGDKDCPALARVILAGLAACNHSPEAQNTLVVEIKAALQRALALTENNAKHSKIQALTGIISTCIEACPTPGHVPNQVFKGQQNTMNQMVKILLKKGIVQDLARVPHSLDLSSPHMAATVNAALKPLETLSRLVNQPQTVVNKAKPKTTEESNTEGIVQEPSSNTQQSDSTEPPAPTATPQDTETGDVHIEDIMEEGNHDDLEVTESQEVFEPLETNSQEEEALEDVLDDLVRGGAGGESEVLGEIISGIVDTADRLAQGDESQLVEVEDFDPHDSQMISQEISDDEGDNTHVEDDHAGSQESHSDDDDDEDDDDQDDDDEEEDNDDDDGEDEEEEDVDDDEGSDMEADNEDFNDLEETMIRMHDDDLFLHLDDPMAFSGTHGQHIVFGGDSGTHFRTYQLPISVHDTDNGNDNANLFPSVPPAPSTVTASHPLLVRNTETHGVGGTMASRLNRGGRQRSTYRLLGPSTAADILQYGHARILLGNHDDARFLFSRDEDFFYDEIFGDLSDVSGSGVLSSVPTALGRWTEEARVLDGDSQNDCVTILKPDIVETLEKYRDEELKERREKRRKTAEEEAAKKEKEKEKEVKEEANKTIEWSTCTHRTTAAEEMTFYPLQPDDSSDSSASFTMDTTSSAVTTTSIPTTSAPVTATTSSSMAIPEPITSSRAGTASETATAERIATAMVEEVLGTPYTTASTSASAPTTEAAAAPVTTGAMGVDQYFEVVGRRITSAPFGGYPFLNPSQEFASLMSVPMPQMLQTPAQGMPITTPAAPAPQQRTADNIAPTPGPAFNIDPLITPSLPTSQLQGIFPTIMPTPSSIPTPSSVSSLPVFDPSMTPAPSAMATPGVASELVTTTPLIMPLPGDGTTPAPPSGIPLQTQASASAPSPVPPPPASESPMDTGSDNRNRLISTLLAETLAGTGVQQQSAAVDLSTQQSAAAATQQSIPTVTTSGRGEFGLQDSNLFPPVPPPSVMADIPQSSMRQGLLSLVMSGLASTPSAVTATSSDPVTTSSTGTTATGTTSSTTTTASTTTSSSVTTTAGAAGGSTSSSTGTPNMFQDIVLPEGVDPSFLAALPDNIRQEVIAEQLRLQRIQQRAQQQNQAAETSGVSEVNPEFLAALPPSIQEEVLAQQRAEQARLQVQESRENPEQAVDAAGFISTLPTSLRQQVLADMDDSMVAVLPPDLAAEAQSLRRELEERHRRIMQERLFSQGAGSLSGILRHSGLASRLGTRYPIRAGGRDGGRWGWSGISRGGTGASTSNANTVRLRGRHLLDHEALTCLLVLLFVDEAKLNTNRLHRVLRNLCYHVPTRNWVVHALLSILQRTSEFKSECIEEPKAGKSSEKLKKKSSQSSNNVEGLVRSDSLSGRSQQPSWLSISMDVALGCRANVFQIHRSGGKKHITTSASNVSIHPQAVPLVCRHVLDTLISLAKSFPSHFLPSKAKEVTVTDKGKEVEKDANKSKIQKTVIQNDVKQQTPSTPDNKQIDTDLWELLVRLDNTSGSKKGKGVPKTHGATNTDSESIELNFDNSPLAQLMTMLAHPVMKRSQLLTDRLLRLLGLISMGLPDVTASNAVGSGAVVRTTVTTTTTTLVGNTPLVTSVASSTSVRPASANELISIMTTPSTTAVTSGETPQTTATTPALPATTVTAIPTQPTSVSTPAQQPAQTGTSLNEAMEIQIPTDETQRTSTPVQKEEEKKTPEEVEKPPETAVLQTQLHLAVQVLTSKACSEEGLEDATSLLLQLSRANNATREAVLKLLLGGARDLGYTVCDHIRMLMVELREMNSKLKDTEEEDVAESTPFTAQPKGLLTDRFGTGTVVVSAPSKTKTGRELQLPSMTQLTCKTSSQHFLLRILKVVIQLREAARIAAKKASRQIANRELSNISEAMAALEAEAEAIMELVGRRDAERQQRSTEGQAQRPAIEGQASNEAEAAPDVASAQAASDSTPATEDVSSSAPGEPETVSETTAASSTSASQSDTPMDVDQPGPSGVKKDEKKKEEEKFVLPRLSEQLQLESLWEMLGDCLTELSKTPDHHAVLVLQPAVEAFFLVHAGEKDTSKPRESLSQRREDQTAHLHVDVAAPMSPAPSQDQGGPLTRENSVASVSSVATNLPPDTQKFLKFAETHRTVLNQILRQSTTPLADGPFSVLVDHTRVLDFDVKRRYFRQELERLDEGMRREDLAVHVRRDQVFEDSFRELHRRSADEWKHRFYVVFEGEEGQDAGGLLREWYLIISREIFNPNYALFATSEGDRVTYTINPSSHYNTNHLSYFKFVGRIIAKAIYDNKLLECYFTRSFYKHILGVPVKYTDMEAEDYSFYKGLVFLLENNIEDLGYEITFSTEIQEFGVNDTRDLKPNGRNIPVTEDQKREYVKLLCQERMTGAIRKQLSAFLEGFYDIIPKKLISIFNEQELELLISGLPTIDIDELKANTEYHKYQANSLQIQWFWRALRSFDQADRARFLQFVTGTSKVPLQGFAHLEGMNGTQKFQIHKDDRSTDRLPCAHTCFNQLDLPAYETYDKLRNMLLLACNECSEGFGLA